MGNTKQGSLALIVSTLGRIDALERLINSIKKDLQHGDYLVIVAQKNKLQVEKLVGELKDFPFSTLFTTSAPGASVGRNTGVEMLPKESDLTLLFPNDTSWFEPGMLNAIRGKIEDYEIGALTVIDEGGPKFVLPSRGTVLNKINVWKVIEPGFWIKINHFKLIGGFDPFIGTGASTPWQAGEVGDLLLRALSLNVPQNCAKQFLWVEPTFFVSGVAHQSGLDAQERRRKQRAYGRGFGYVVSRWNYPLWFKIAILAHGPISSMTSKNKPFFDGWWVLLGRFEGLRGKLLGKLKTIAAVER